MLSSHTVGFQRPDNSNLANLTPGLCSSSWSWLALLKNLAGNQWGAAETVLKNVYIGTIRPHLEYGSTTQQSTH